MTFQIGDRVKCIRPDDYSTLTMGQIYTVTGPGPGRDIHVACIDESWMPSRFELYAKAGEFVVGDQVVARGNTAEILIVSEVGRCGIKARSAANFMTDIGPFSAFRLATPEEIAAAEGSKVTPKPFGPFFNILGEPDTRATASHISTASPTTRSEIPAADFDFDRIKRGDVVVVHRTVDRDGLTHIGNVSVDPIGGFIKPSRIHSVIPSPKPKTLRERAIEAAKGVEFDGAYVGNMSALKAAVVDLVLAEVEKGR